MTTMFLYLKDDSKTDDYTDFTGISSLNFDNTRCTSDSSCLKCAKAQQANLAMVVIAAACCFFCVIINYKRAFPSSLAVGCYSEVTGIVMGWIFAAFATICAIISVIVYAQGCQQVLIDLRSGLNYTFGPSFG